MTALCTEADLLARPALIRVTLSDAQTASIPGFSDEASVLIEGYIGHTFAGTDDDPVPTAAVIVCARVVARALTATPVDPNFDAYGSTIGPFAHSKRVAPDVLGGGVWLTKQDKLALDSIGGAYSRMTNIALYDLGWCPPAPPDWWEVTPASSGL